MLATSARYGFLTRPCPFLSLFISNSFKSIIGGGCSSWTACRLARAPLQFCYTGPQKRQHLRSVWRKKMPNFVFDTPIDFCSDFRPFGPLCETFSLIWAILRTSMPLRVLTDGKWAVLRYYPSNFRWATHALVAAPEFCIAKSPIS